MFTVRRESVGTCVVKLFIKMKHNLPIPVAARSKVSVCDRSLAGNAGSNLAGSMNVCL